MSARAAFALLALALLPRAGAPAAAQADAQETAQVDGRTQAREKRVELLLRWREALELDLASEVVREARELVEPGGALATDGEALALYAAALCDGGQSERAQALLAASAPSPRTRSAVEVALARIDLEADRLAEVERRLAADKGSLVPVLHPERAECWLVLGRARARAAGLEDAAPLLATFVQRWPLHPEAPSAWYMLAQEAIGRRDLERARACRERAEQLAAWHGYYRARRLQIRERPEEPLPRLGLAQLWIAVGELERAREVLLELARIAPDFCRAHATLGEVQRKLGALSLARAAYDRALACDPTQAEVRFNRALLALHEGRKQEARADFEQLVGGPAASDPRILEAHLHLARLLLEAGEKEAAEQRYERYRAGGGEQPLQGD